MAQYIEENKASPYNLARATHRVSDQTTKKILERSTLIEKSEQRDHNR